MAESDSAITQRRKPNPVCQGLSPCGATKLRGADSWWDANHDVIVISVGVAQMARSAMDAPLPLRTSPRAAGKCMQRGALPGATA
ncbi:MULTISPECIES: hypothetical protein [Xanthomonas translucens group]|uniref:hypothetical protein n=1 Tax=Xanthomonas translucens group TaxID=3390202 RepID=UPI001111C63A|nr:hypothetical protein [Xanthomonas translucens]MBC3971225.1 hypothetical protein [Xanthomonas translucens pv. undulosa]MCT8270308.1 hypothetical protein [Xanthomonas translucens pv. undulosa]MCT8282399.1 hypothetical protein [Xanthomonas translucens pv. undulosa]MCT8317088.1 hypothetical protein [Xanthomonas translucens pv. undulosa]QEN92061.1 hypothetical protein F0H33_00460 [Xanthomonas translucens pv. undulosa]